MRVERGELRVEMKGALRAIGIYGRFVNRPYVRPEMRSPLEGDIHE